MKLEGGQRRDRTGRDNEEQKRQYLVVVVAVAVTVTVRGPLQSSPSSMRAGPIRLRHPSRPRWRTSSCPASRVGGHETAGDRVAGRMLRGGELGRCGEVESGVEMGWPEMGNEGEGGDWRRWLWLR
jgi:hypothetical protein